MSSIIDLPGTEGINLCRKCGSILVSGECPECSIVKQAEGMREALDTAEKQEKADKKARSQDAYRVLEDQVAMYRTRQRQIKKMLSIFTKALAVTEDPLEAEKIAKASATLDRGLGVLGTGLSKVSKEMLAFQTARSKLVSEMTVDEQMAQIIRWHSHLPEPRQLILIETLTQEYNRSHARRAAQKALRRQKRSGSDE